MSPAFDRMKLPHGGQMGSLKMSIVTGAAELPMKTPSSRTRSSIASAAGAGGCDADGPDDRHGWATTRTAPTSATTMKLARPTHSQALRARPGDGWPHDGVLVLATSPVPQPGAPGHPVGCGIAPLGGNG